MDSEATQPKGTANSPQMTQYQKLLNFPLHQASLLSMCGRLIFPHPLLVIESIAAIPRRNKTAALLSSASPVADSQQQVEAPHGQLLPGDPFLSTLSHDFLNGVGFTCSH